MAREQEQLEARLAALESEVARLSRRGKTEEARLDENLRRFGVRGTGGKARLDRSGLQIKSTGDDNASRGAITWAREFFPDADHAPDQAGAMAWAYIEPSLDDLVWLEIIAAQQISDAVSGGILTSPTLPFASLELAVDSVSGRVFLTADNPDTSAVFPTLLHGGISVSRARITIDTDQDEADIIIGAERIFLAGAVCYDATLSPAQITGDQDDYAPTGIESASWLRLSTDASRNINSLKPIAHSNGKHGREIAISNIGAQNIVLVNAAASGTAEWRFLFGANLTLNANESVILRYDDVTERWRCLGKHV